MSFMNWRAVLLFLAVAGFQGCTARQEQAAPAFLEAIDALRDGAIESLALSRFVDEIEKKPVRPDGEIDAWDLEMAKTLDARVVEPVQARDVLFVGDKFILLVVREENTRALTISSGGEPLEMVLLNMSEGNNEYKISRAFDYWSDVNYRFDAERREFAFTDLRYDTEWIAPGKGLDVVAYRTRIVLRVDEEGRFVVVGVEELPHELGG